MANYSLGLLFMLALLGWRCAGSQAPGDGGIRRVKLYVRYLEPTGQLYAEALFERDSALGVDLGGEVRLNGLPLRGTSLPRVGYRYQSEFRPETLPDSLQFKYPMAVSGDSLFGLPMIALRGISIPSGGFTKSKGGKVAWQSAPCTDQEALVLRITDAAGQPFTVNHVGRTRGSELDVLDLHVKTAAPGKASIALTRKLTTTARQGKTEIVAIVEYYTNEIPALIAEQ